MLWQLADFIPHLPAPVRALEIRVEDAGGPEPRVHLSLRAPDPGRAAVPLPHPRPPGHILALVLPEPEHAGLEGQPPQIQADYLGARERASRDWWAEVRVVCAPPVSSAVAIDAVLSHRRGECAVGVLAEQDTVVVAVPESYRGPDAGRVITLRESPGPEPGPAWLYPSALYAALGQANLAEHFRGGMFVAGEHELPDPPAALTVEVDGAVHRIEVTDVRIDRWPRRPYPMPA